MLQPPEGSAGLESGAETTAEGFNAGEVIMGHVSNSDPEHPLLHLPAVLGIDFSVSKHVLMLWVVAALVFVTVTRLVRKYVKQERLEPSGMMNALEAIVVFVRDGIARPNVGDKWLKAWTPMLLSLFVFILMANAIGMIPLLDVLALLNHTVLHPGEESLLTLLTHGGTTATGNFNVTAALATITFFSIIVAGTQAHGFIGHWKNLVPKGLSWPVYIILIPIEILSLFVRPFALTMRLAANMTGGHIAILAIISFVFIFAELFGRAVAGIGVGIMLSMPLAVGVSALEIIVILVQAYVFTLLSAVFIGMAIHAHH
jgi:F-type H+-transporting ATPase subunit a